MLYRTGGRMILMLRHTLIWTSALVLAVLAGTTQATHITCGDTIGPNESAVLDEDLVCVTPVLTIEGPAELDLNGFVVQCASHGNGIEIFGKRAVLSNGTVTRCGHAVAIWGVGGHRIENVAAINNNVGFIINEGSDNNRLHDNYAEDNHNGFVTIGNRNRLKNNETIGGGGIGISTSGDHNRFKQNISTNHHHGFSDHGFRNRYTFNFASGNDFHGFSDCCGSSKVTIKNNIASDNWFNGIDLTENDGVVSGNHVANNSRNGIYVIGDDWIISGNQVKDNFDSGILMGSSAHNNLVTKNVVLGNGLVDLQHWNTPDCGDSTWRNNIFETSDPVGCID